MKKIIGIVPIVLALAAATPALARAHHHGYRSDPAPSSQIDSGWGPPTNWNDIEISTPSCC